MGEVYGDEIRTEVLVGNRAGKRLLTTMLTSVLKQQNEKVWIGYIWLRKGMMKLLVA